MKVVIILFIACAVVSANRWERRRNDDNDGWGRGGDRESDLRRRDKDLLDDYAPGRRAGLGAGLGAGLDSKNGKPGLGKNNGWGNIKVKGDILEGGGARAGVGSGQDRGGRGKGRW